MSEPTVSLSLRVRPELKEELGREARRGGVSLQAEVVQRLERSLSKGSPAPRAVSSRSEVRESAPVKAPEGPPAKRVSDLLPSAPRAGDLAGKFRPDPRA
jgi:hypothetical protein